MAIQKDNSYNAYYFKDQTGTLPQQEADITTFFWVNLFAYCNLAE